MVLAIADEAIGALMRRYPLRLVALTRGSGIAAGGFLRVGLGLVSRLARHGYWFSYRYDIKLWLWFSYRTVG